MRQIAPRLAVIVNSGQFGEPVVELDREQTGMLLQVPEEKWRTSQAAREGYAALIGNHFQRHHVLVVAHKQDEEFEKAVVDFCERLKNYRRNLRNVQVVGLHQLQDGPLSEWLVAEDHMHFDLLKNAVG